MNWLSWVWLALAAILIIGEIFTTGFFLLWFGIAAAAAAVAAFLGGGLALQWIIFIALSLVLWAFSRRFAKRILKDAEPDSVGANRFKGLKGMVIEEIDNMHAKGMVRIEREEWRAESVDEEVIPKGARVEVVDISGTRLLVKVLVEQPA